MEKTYPHGAFNTLPLAYTFVSLPGMEAPEGWSPRLRHGPGVAHQGQALGQNCGHTNTLPRGHSCAVNPRAGTNPETQLMMLIGFSPRPKVK